MVEATSESHQYDSVTGVRLPKTWRHGNLETSRSSPESRARVLHALESWKPWILTEINKNLSKLESTTSSICRTVFQVSGNPEMCTIHRKPGNFLQKLELLMWQRLATNHIASHHISVTASVEPHVHLKPKSPISGELISHDHDHDDVDVLLVFQDVSGILI